ncbi:GntT/GntP/DsdX family permease [Escherichia coli]
MMLLIIGGGGAFKQVLVDSGVDKYIASMMHETNISPLLMASSRSLPYCVSRWVPQPLRQSLRVVSRHR